MELNLGKYRKLIAAVIGLAVVVFSPEFIQLDEQGQLIMQTVLSILAAAGVYQFPNDPE